MEKILEKLKLTQDNPGYFKALSPEEQAELFLYFLQPKPKLFKKPKIIQGIDGKTPTPDKDYISKETALTFLSDVEKTLKQKNSQLETAVQKKLSTLKPGKDGEDAVITDDLKQEIAKLTASLVELPDFDVLITQEPESVRNSLELLPDDEKLSQEAIENLPEDLNELRDAITNYAKSHGGIGKRQVYNFIEQAIADGTISDNDVAAVWGNITGTLSDQTDLQTALDAKLDIADNLSDLADAATARTNLGLGTFAVENLNAAPSITMEGDLIIDDATASLGIGTATPTAAFEMRTNGGGSYVGGFGAAAVLATTNSNSWNLIYGNAAVTEANWMANYMGNNGNLYFGNSANYSILAIRNEPAGINAVGVNTRDANSGVPARDLEVMADVLAGDTFGIINISGAYADRTTADGLEVAELTFGVRDDAGSGAGADTRTAKIQSYYDNGVTGGDLRFLTGASGGTQALLLDINQNATFASSVEADSFNATTATAYQQSGATILTVLNGEATAGLFIGEGAGAVTTGIENTFIGYQAGNANITGYENVFIGYQAGLTSTSLFSVYIGHGSGLAATGNNNVAVGWSTASALTGGQNTIVGQAAGANSTGANSNTFIGYRAGNANVGGDNLCYLGAYAGEDATGNFNTLVGYSAGKNISTGASNTIFGSSGGSSVSTGSQNCLFGIAAGGNISAEDDNSYFGNNAGQRVIGASNTAMGRYAGAGSGFGNKTFSNTTSFGYHAGYNVGTGADNNIFIGYQAGDNSVSGANNIFIGYDINAQTASASNQLSIGNLIFSEGIDGTGATISTGNIGIGVVAPSEKLHIDGNLLIGTGATGVDYVLKFDGETNDGTLTYMEDEDRLDFSMPIKVPTYERHVTIHTGSIGKGATAPVDTVVGTSQVLVFSADAETVYIATEIPGDWDGISDIKMEVHWLPITAIADTETVKWDISYRTKTTGEAIDGGTATTASGTHTQSGAGTAKERIDTLITLPYNDANNPIVAGDIIFIEFTRDMTGDTFAGDAGVAIWGVELNSTTIPKG